jgi:hypothetical protein
VRHGSTIFAVGPCLHSGSYPDPQCRADRSFASEKVELI